MHKAVSLTAGELRCSFGSALSEEESDNPYERWAIPASGRPLLEASAASFSPHCPDKVNAGSEGRGPLLLIMGGQDHAAPGAITRSTLRHCRHSSAVTDLEGRQTK